MKNVVIVWIFALAVIPSSLYSQIQNESTRATIVSVRENNGVDPMSYAGSNPSDTPMQARIYAYDIAIRLNCTNYVVHYESASDYLPSAFAVNHQISARNGKHRLYFDVPGYGPMDMPIASHSRVQEGSCRSFSGGPRS